MLRIEKYDATAERLVLIGCVVSKAVLGAVSSRWDANGLFGNRWCDLIAGWCVVHYQKYRKPPGPHIEWYFDRWAADVRRDKDTVRLVEAFLQSLSGEYERQRDGINPDVVIDIATGLFKKVKLRQLRDQIDGMLETNEIDKADTAVHEYRRVELGTGSEIDVVTDRAAWEAAFTTVNEVLFKYNQEGLDNFFGDVFARDCFVAFWGKEKVGKSFWLQLITFLAASQGRKVAYFQTGDMSQNQVLRRLGALVAGRPYKADSRVMVPVEIHGGDPPEINHEDRGFPEPMTLNEAFAAAEKICPPGNFRLTTYPSDSVSILDIESTVERWANDEWVPDLLVLDYADLLAPVNGQVETRHQIDATWKGMRRLSQEIHCCLVTATQSDAASFTAEVLTRSNFTDNHRKLAHPTATIGINRTARDITKRAYRLNHVATRELEFPESKCVWCAECLPLAHPAMLSIF